jgi:hypothetical protein
MPAASARISLRPRAICRSSSMHSSRLRRFGEVPHGGVVESAVEQIFPRWTNAPGQTTGKLKALVAVARSILTIAWHLLADPTARYHDLGADYHTRRIDTERRTRSHVRQLEALGCKVTLAAA